MSEACGRARRVLWPVEGPQATSPEVEEAQRHLKSCEACRGFVDEIRDTVDVVDRHAPRPEAPAPVRERVFRAVARERTRGERGRDATGPGRSEGGGPGGGDRRRWPVAVGLAVLVAVGAWIGLQRSGSDGATGGLGAYVEDHLRARHHGEIESSDPETVRRWLSDRVSFAVSVPRLPGAEVEGGRLCFLEGRTGTVVRYRVDGKPVSYFVMPGDGTKSPRSQADAFRSEARSGYHVVAWRHEGLVHALVGDLPRQRLSELAEVCSEQVAAAGPAPSSTPAPVPARSPDADLPTP